MTNKHAEQLITYALSCGATIDQDYLNAIRTKTDTILSRLHQRILNKCIQNERIQVKALDATKQIGFFI